MNNKVLGVIWKIQCKLTEGRVSRGHNQQEVSLCPDFLHKIIKNPYLFRFPFAPDLKERKLGHAFNRRMKEAANKPRVKKEVF